MSRLKAAIDGSKVRLPRVAAPVQVQDSSLDQSLVVFYVYRLFAQALLRRSIDGISFVCLAAHVRSLVGGSLGRDRRNCQTFAASPAEPGDLPWLLAYGARRLFLKQEASEQRQLLNFVLSNS